jgi:hypothetical protein
MTLVLTVSGDSYRVAAHAYSTLCRALEHDKALGVVHELTVRYADSRFRWELTDSDQQTKASFQDNSDGSFFLPNVLKHNLNNYLSHNNLQPQQLTGWSLLCIANGTVKTCPSSKHQEPQLLLLDSHDVVSIPQANAQAALSALHRAEKPAKRLRRAS